MSISTNKTSSYTKEPTKKLTSLKLFPKKLSNSKLHNLKLKKDNKLTLTRENIKNLFGNKLTTTTTTTKNSPNSSLYISQTTNNIEFSFSNNNNISQPTDHDHPNKDFNFTFQNDFTFTDINDSLLQLESQHIKLKQTFNSNITIIERYLHLLEQVITLIGNYDDIKEHILLDKICNGLKEYCMLIKVKYMKLNRKYHLQSKEMCEYKEHMRKLKDNIINNNKERNNKQRINNQEINFIDNINIFEDNSVHFKERDVELESLYFKDKVRMTKNRSLKNTHVPTLDLSFNQQQGKEGKCNKDKKGYLNKSVYVNNVNGNNSNVYNNNNNNNQIQRNIICFKMTTQNKHRPKSKSFSMFSPINIDNTSINNMNH